MRELRDAHRLALEPRESPWIHRQLRGEDLDGHFAIEPRIARAIYLAHAARADGGNDLVVSEAGAGRQRHRTAILRAPACGRRPESDAAGGMNAHKRRELHAVVGGNHLRRLFANHES